MWMMRPLVGDSYTTHNHPLQRVAVMSGFPKSFIFWALRQSQLAARMGAGGGGKRRKGSCCLLEARSDLSKRLMANAKWLDLRRASEVEASGVFWQKWHWEWSLVCSKACTGCRNSDGHQRQCEPGARSRAQGLEQLPGGRNYIMGSWGQGMCPTLSPGKHTC